MWQTEISTLQREFPALGSHIKEGIEAMNRTVGVDSLSPVTPELIAQATTTLGQCPSFWGRYFTSPTTEGSGEYHHATESPVLAAAGIRVLPIARQTNRVGGTYSDGFNDGQANVQDLDDTFGAAYLNQCIVPALGRLYLFLDVEGSGLSHLSVDYYEGWCDALDGSAFCACVYGIPGDTATWTALKWACAHDRCCSALWLSHPIRQPAEPQGWSSDMLKPFQDFGIKIALWQYAFGGMFDRDLLNPNEPWLDQNYFLQHLILPQSGA